ncbi:hypothetical protein AGMMS50284_4430 [Clostridia bacterium]|nr:hypothetical protein AGMMS50284_4430 [Clostridia bacterium]
MAGLAERHQVFVIMRTALINRPKMMDFISWNKSVRLETLFAKRMSSDVTVTNQPPAVTVNLIMVWRALIAVIFAGSFGFVFGAKTFVGQFRASGVAARVR